MIGGLTGGLFQFFDIIGSAFFIVLIGKERTNRDELRSNRVNVGGYLTFTIAYAFIALCFGDRIFVGDSGKPWSLFFVILLSFPVGLLGLL